MHNAGLRIDLDFRDVRPRREGEIHRIEEGRLIEARLDLTPPREPQASLREILGHR